MKKHASKLILASLALISSVLAGCGKHTHTLVEHEAHDATCTEDGNIAYWTCEECEGYFDANGQEISEESIVIAKKGHNMTHHEEKAGTDCLTKDGNVEYWHCSNCEHDYSDENGNNVLDDVHVYGAHKLTVHEAKAAKCEEAGNIYYSECSTCQKYFNEDGNEITENSWILNATGHNYTSLAFSGSYATEYIIGEQFDRTNLVVKKVCSNDGCDHQETVNPDDVSIYYENGNSFVYGDTKVTVKVGTLTKDISIAVNKKTNVIGGVKSSYEGHCQEPISLDDISATSGEVSVKYYIDENHKNEVSSHDLVKGTYYVVFKTDGVDADYDVATAESIYYVYHDYLPEENYGKIGYKLQKCSGCSYIGNSTDLMSDNDIVLTEHFVDEQEKDNYVAHYGMNNDMFVGSDYHPMWLSADYTDNIVDVDVALPLVDYRLFDNVIFMWDATNDYTGQVYQLSIGGTKLLDHRTAKTGLKGTIKVVYSSVDGGSLDITLKCDDGTVATAVVDDDSVICGDISLTVTFGSTWSRQFHLTNVYVNHNTCTADPDECSNRTDKIGYKATHCVKCGEIMDTTTPMTNNDIDLSNISNYGMNASALTAGNTEGIEEANYPGWWETQDVKLPLTNYNAFNNVVFVLYSASATWGGGYIGFGINTQDDLLPYVNHGTAAKSSLEITVKDGVLNIKVSCNDGTTNVQTLSNSNVICGKENLVLKFHGVNYRAIYLRNVFLNHTHTAGTELTCPTDKIGYKVALCTSCYSPCSSSTAMTSTEIKLENKYGAKCQKATGEALECVADSTKILYAPGDGDFDGECYMPRVQYKAYKSVTFTFYVDSLWGKFGFSKDESIGGFNNSTYSEVTLTITKASSNLYYASLNYGGLAEPITSTVTSDSVLSGESSLVMYVNPGAYSWFYISSITVEK